MSKRNYRELWQQLKTVILLGGKRRYTRKELYEMLTHMELAQLSQDPFKDMLEAMPGIKEVAKE